MKPVIPDYQTVALAAVKDGAQQDPGELALMLQLAGPGRRRFAIELGYGNGATAAAFAALGYNVISVDPQPEIRSEPPADVTLIQKASRAAFDDVAALAGKRPVHVLLIDGDHSAEGARGDWDQYWPLVDEGGLIFVHDTERQDGPKELVHQLRSLDVPVITFASRPGDSPGFAIIRTRLV